MDLSGTKELLNLVKNLPAVQETQEWSLGQEDPLKKEMTTHSSSLAWRIPTIHRITKLDTTEQLTLLLSKSYWGFYSPDFCNLWGICFDSLETYKYQFKNHCSWIFHTANKVRNIRINFNKQGFQPKFF